MMTLSKLLSTKGSKPFTTPVKVKIGGIGKTSKYVTDKGDNKEITTVGFCDKTSAMKGVVYYQTKIIPYKEGSTVMLLNYVFKADPSPTIIITTKTKVMKTSDLEVPDEYWAKAALIANPPPAECLTLKKVKLSPIKSMVSLKGKVVSEEIVKTVQVRGTDVLVKSVKISDGTDDLKVSLWREMSLQNLIGQYVQLTNVVVNTYRDEVSVSTTTKTEIKTCQEPSSQIEGDVQAYETGEDKYTIIMEIDNEFSTYEVSQELLCKALDCSSTDLDETLQKKILLATKLTITEGNVSVIVLSSAQMPVLDSSN